MRKLMVVFALLFSTIHALSGPYSLAHAADGNRVLEDNLRTTLSAQTSHADRLERLVYRGVRIYSALNWRLKTRITLHDEADLAEGARIDKLLTRCLTGSGCPLAKTLTPLALLEQRAIKRAEAASEMSEVRLQALEQAVSLAELQAWVGEIFTTEKGSHRQWRAQAGGLYGQAATLLKRRNLASAAEQERMERLILQGAIAWKAAGNEARALSYRQRLDEVKTAWNNRENRRQKALYAATDPLATKARQSRRRGDAVEAAQHYKAWMIALIRHHGEHSLATARGQREVGDFFAEQGDFTMSRIHYTYSVKTANRGFNVEDAVGARAMNGLGLLLAGQGMVKKAEKMLLRSQNSAPFFGCGFTIMNVLNNLGTFYSEQGAFEKAETALELSIQLSIKYGGQHPEIRICPQRVEALRRLADVRRRGLEIIGKPLLKEVMWKRESITALEDAARALAAEITHQRSEPKQGAGKVERICRTSSYESCQKAWHLWRENHMRELIDTLIAIQIDNIYTGRMMIRYSRALGDLKRKKEAAKWKNRGERLKNRKRPKRKKRG